MQISLLRLVLETVFKYILYIIDVTNSLDYIEIQYINVTTVMGFIKYL